MNNELATGSEKTSKFRDIGAILKDPAQKAKLNNLVDEAVRCKTKIHGEQETIKDLRDVAKTDLGLNPKLFNAYVSSVFNNDYMVRRDSHMQLVDLLDAVIGLLPESNSNYVNDDE